MISPPPYGTRRPSWLRVKSPGQSPGESLSEQQLEDLDVNRQRERLEHSREQPGNKQTGEQENQQKERR